MKFHDFIITVFFLSIFFTVFVMTEGLPDPYSTGKNYYFTIAISFWLILFILMCFSSRLNFSINTLDCAIGLYFLYIILNNIAQTTININEDISAKLYLCVFYYLSKFILIKLNSHIRTEQIFKINYLAFVVILCFAFIQLITFSIYGAKLQFNATSFVNSGPYAIYLSGFILSSVAYLLFEKRNNLVAFTLLGGILLVAFFFLFLTTSRTAIISLFLGILFIFSQDNRILQIAKIFLNQPYKIKFIYCAFIIVCGYFISFAFYIIKKPSADGRFFIWKICKNIITDNFLFGSGFNGFVRKFYTYQSNYFQYSKFANFEILIADPVKYSFNSYINIFIESGLLGLLLFIIITLIVFYHSYSMYRESKRYGSLLNWLDLAVFAFLINFYTSMFFSYSLETLPLAINFYFVLSYISFKIKKAVCTIIIDFSKFYVKGIATLSCFILIFIIKENVISMEAKQNWEAYKINNNNPHIKCIEYAKNYKELKNYGPFIIAYSNCFLQLSEYEKAYALLYSAQSYISDTSYYRTLGDCCFKLHKYEEAEFAYLKYIYIIPGRFVPKKKLLDFYINRKDTQNIINVSNEILRTPIKIHSAVIDSIKLLAKKSKIKFCI